MPKKAEKNPADYILPLYINGLEGRMLRMPAKRGKKREMLFVYGNHSSLERWFGVAQELNKYGTVTMPDLPGFGGMDSLYKIGKPATVDNLADYLAAFIKLKYRNKKVTIIGMSMGFVIVTRMLQRYPSLTKNVEMLVSIVGFVHKDDFIFKKSIVLTVVLASRLLSRKWPSMFYKHIVLRPFLIRLAYHRLYSAREKFAGLAGDEFKRTMDTEVELWRINDPRTHMKSYVDMLTLDNCKKRINLPVTHVAVKTDRYFNNDKVEEHMRKVFSDFNLIYAKINTHAPTIIADAKTAAPLIPRELRRTFSRKDA